MGVRVEGSGSRERTESGGDADGARCRWLVAARVGTSDRVRGAVP
jgi:hypothetical protein